jgi:hypothetical protein
MNNVPPDHERPDDADELYRRASARDTSQPSEAVRRAVAAHAAQLAAQRVPRASRGRFTRIPSMAAHAWRRPAVFGSVAAAVIAGLVIAPLWRVLGPHTAPSTFTAQELPTAVTPSQAPQPRLEVPPPPPAAASVPANIARDRTVAGQAPLTSRAPPVRAAEKPAPASPPPAELAELADRGLQAGKAGASAPDAHAVRGGFLTSIQPKPPSASAAASVSVTAARRSNAAAPQDQTAVDPAQAFRQAAEKGDLTALESLLDKQSNIDARDAEGRTALMLAVEHGQGSAVSTLLAYGADPNAADAHGTTPLQAATAGGQSAIIASLHSYGAR